MQEVDAARRLAILRGEAPPPIEDEVLPAPEAPRSSIGGGDSGSGERRKRKRRDEDDTEFEMRLANERNEPRSSGLEASRKPTSSAPITDRKGHIDLFGDEKARAHAEKNEEAEREKKKRKQEHEDQYTMRFSKAAGKDGISNPWYSQAELAAHSGPLSSKDVWGNDDPSRKGRDVQRTVASDPLAMMKLGASKVREVKAERRKLQAEQREELRKLGHEQREESRHRRERRGREHRRRTSRSRSRERRHGRESPDRSRHRSHSRRHGEKEHREIRQSDDNAGRRRQSSRERHDKHTRSHRDHVEPARKHGRQGN